jgi:serine/threonine protein kinase
MMGEDLRTAAAAALEATRPLSATEPRLAPSRRVAGSTVALPPGYRLLEYRIDGVLGQGGFGIVYAATDTHLNARVVIKEYLPEELAYRAADDSVSPRADQDQDHYQHGLDDFLVEARTLATFRHPNIVRVARFFEANRTAYMVLEYERGQSLKQWRRRLGELPEEAIVALLAPLLDGLAAVHRSGYLHRDIKPDNIYVRDEDGSVVLLDFGAARQATAE